MKLVKIKLINWHIFSNHTIELNGNALITGENASGKSTIMDAIYFVLSAGDSHHFNKAASDGGQRTLETYLRCKLGNENKEYVRNQKDVLGFVVLEFLENNGRTHNCLGCSMEIVNFGKPKAKFFVINNYKIKDNDFIKDNQILSFSQFKSNFKAFGTKLDELNNDSRKERMNKIGRGFFKLNDYNRYFTLLQSAISFKPIDEVSTFVNSFLLQEDNIDLGSLKEEIRSYHQIHKALLNEKDKIECLREFTPKAEQYIGNLKKLDCLALLKIRSDIENYEDGIRNCNLNIQKLNNDLSQTRLSIDSLEDKIERYNREIHNLENDETYKALKEKKDTLEKYKKELSEIINRKNNFIKMISNEYKISKDLGLSYRMDEDVKGKNYPLLKTHLERYKNEKNEIENKYLKDNASKNLKAEINNKSIKDKQSELENLKKGINNYPNETITLINLIKEAIKEKYKRDSNIDVRPLCEHIDIKDKNWADALEGYLGDRRFDLIIEPKYFDIAQKVVEENSIKLSLHKSGIFDYSKCSLPKEVKNSLIQKVEIKTKLGGKYIESILNNVACVNDVDELRKFESSITKEGIYYKNYVISVCNPETYKKPFIGADSIKKRIELLEKEIFELKGETHLLEEDINKNNEKLSVIKSSKVDGLLEYENVWQREDQKVQSIDDLEEEIRINEQDKGLLETSQRLETAKLLKRNAVDERSNLNSQLNEINEEKGKQKTILLNLEDSITSNKSKFEEQFKNGQIDIDLYSKCESFYRNGKKLNREKIDEDVISLTHTNGNYRPGLELTMRNYSQKYKQSLPALIENLQDFINEYYGLINRGVVEFESKAKEAYDKAQISFKEDFLSKLKEKIDKSKKMLDKINKNLQLHPFGNDEEIYKFHYEQTKDNEFYHYYRIITSGKLMETKDLFTELLDDKDYQYMQQLFENISMEATTSEAEAKLNKYLDYRNYMNYDIRIVNKYGDVSYFSKISKEKSGGETQTPFYIVIASCFDELMNKDINKGESTCQVVFDEAFNNMDESRIESLMEFYKQLNIQVIIIAPSNRISAIASHMDTVLGVIKDKNIPYIADLNKIN